MPAIPTDAPIPEALPEPPEYPSPRIVDSRRLMGPNIYDADEGALLEVRVGDLDEATQARLYADWELAARVLAGWPTLEVQVHSSGVADSMRALLFLSAPVDQLMTATEVAEQAWVCAERRIGDTSIQWSVDDALAARIDALAAAERATRPHIADVHETARARDITVAFDDEHLSLGSGVGSLTWALADMPHARTIAWDTVHDVPVSLVTGSNGKTTTTRLVAAMWRRAGKVTGWSCSDGVWVDDEQLESGDYSGPSGARVVLRDDRVEAAVLETARGGILRRGLAVHHATAGIITNIAADHFGEYGINNLDDLAKAKFVLRHALYGGGQLVLNADDATLVAMAPIMEARVAWFSMRESPPMLAEHLLNGGNAAALRAGHVMLHHANVWHDLGDATAMPLTLGGAAPHNVANILGASLLAAVSGVPINAIRQTVQTFGASAADNAGRLQLHRFGGVSVLVDYAHNPEGLAALCRTAASLPATRRLLVLGQAGDRDESQLRALVAAAWSVTHFDRVIVKDMERLLRGRGLGELPAIFVDELAQLGAPSDDVDVAPSEFDAIKRAFAWAHDGDVLVCPVHIDKQLVLAWLARLRDANWQPGMVLPD